jgi:hypothetical protein
MQMNTGSKFGGKSLTIPRNQLEAFLPGQPPRPPEILQHFRKSYSTRISLLAEEDFKERFRNIIQEELDKRKQDMQPPALEQRHPPPAASEHVSQPMDSEESAAEEDQGRQREDPFEEGGCLAWTMQEDDADSSTIVSDVMSWEKYDPELVTASNAYDNQEGGNGGVGDDGQYAHIEENEDRGEGGNGSQLPSPETFYTPNRA